MVCVSFTGNGSHQTKECISDGRGVCQSARDQEIVEITVVTGYIQYASKIGG